MKKFVCVALLASFVAVGCESMKKEKSTTQPAKMSAEGKTCADGKCTDKK